MSATTRTMIDAAAGGTLMGETPEEAYELLDEMASNNYQWSLDRMAPKRATGVDKINVFSVLAAQVVNLSNQLGNMNVNVIQSTNVICDFCAGNHASIDCQVRSPFAISTSKQTNFVSYFQRQNNPYSNTYNLGWRNHPNFSWGNTQNTLKPPLGFQPQEKKPNLEDLITQFITKFETKFQNQDATIRNLERQIGQLASMISERPQGSLPSNTETNPKKQVQAITLRSGKELEIPKENNQEAEEKQELAAPNLSSKSEASKEEATPSSPMASRVVKEATKQPPYDSSFKPYVLLIPFPQRLKKKIR